MAQESTATNSPKTSRRRVWMRRLRRALLLYVVTPYVAVALILALFQRSLIYRPECVETIRIEDAHLPAGMVDAISLQTDDGLELHGWHLKTTGHHAQRPTELAARRPLVLYFPGNSLNRTYLSHDCQDLTALGADVFLFDYRGYGDNPGSPSEEKIASDAYAIWKYATVEHNVAAGRIVIFGESLGGGVATRLVARLCDEGTPPAGLILSSTFSSLVDTAADQYPWFPVRWMLLDRYSSAARVGSVTCAVLQFHGVKDDIVPYALGEKLFAAVPEQSAGRIKKRFVTLKKAGHNYIPKVKFREFVLPFMASVVEDAGLE